MSAKTIPLKSLLLLAGSAIALAGCKIDNRPLLARGEPQTAAVALPQPGPIDPNTGAPVYSAYPTGGQVIPARAYPYAERAYALDRAFYDVPPDYGFYYGDEEPWVWETADDSLMFAEPYGDWYRFYYYEPGDPYPYFVQDADYGYAFGQDGALIALFDAAGALLSADEYDRYYPQARQYWSRGYDMRQDYGRAPRQPVSPQVWSRQAPRVERAQQTWINAPASQPAWRQWRASDAGRAVAQRVDAVRSARAAGMAPGGGRGGFRGFDAAPAPTTMAAAGPAERGRRFSPQGRMRFEGPPAMARNERGRFAPGPVAPSAQEHGRWAAERAPAFQSTPMQRAEARAPHGSSARFAQAPSARIQPHGGHEWGGGAGPAHLAEAAPPRFQPHAGGHQWRGGGGPEHAVQAAPPQFQPHGGGGGWHGGGPAHFAQAAPPQVQPAHGGGGWHGGGGGQPHFQPPPQAPPAQQPHPGGGGQPHGQGGGNGHGQGGGGHDHKHGG